MTNTATKNWREVELGDVIDFFDSKRVPLNSTQRQNRQGVYPYYGASGVIDHIDDFIFDGDYLLIAEDGENLNSRKLPIAFWARGKFWVNNHAHIVRGKEKVANTEFLKNWFANANISGYVTGSAQPKLSQQNLKMIKLSLPEFTEQEQIADTLSRYNYLIENISSRIKILEEMAQNIYTEWFVSFHFPDHEKVKMTDSGTDFGKIPQGWTVKKLGEKIDISRGRNITKKTVEEGNIPVVAGGLEPAYYHSTANTEAPVVTVSASGANAGFVNLYMENVWASDCSYIDKGVTPFVLYYFLLLKSRQIEVTGLQRGSAQPHVYPKDLSDLLVVDVPDHLLENFEDIVGTIFSFVGNLKKQNKALRDSRDLLLPKLVTGEIETKKS